VSTTRQIEVDELENPFDYKKYKLLEKKYLVFNFAIIAF